ncbi:hypothetical protein BDY17DRAFT_293293 [Neohortaea acidophila]|uniref:Uncharacterized protein n=1 Tax=Neohortaea acidophila TaxID=245834 RepID=A0A6A6Q0U0_9PEZI|nr:uncharacterized protein BDY17DRAFT_293293 [Neohortaea acidophila]KAF2485303.1 hypothetical protein BDY17DRAFT_293293 [Neohortaea acidophila]
MIAMKPTSPKGIPNVRRKPTPTDSLLDHSLPYAHAPDPEHSHRSGRVARLPHTARTSMPHDEHQEVMPSVGRIRTCSLNCHTDGGRCLDRRTASNSSTLFGPHQTPPGIKAVPTPHIANKQQQEDSQLLSHLFEILITAVLAAATACKHIRLPTLPRPGALEALYSDETSPQQKARALKALLSLSGQVVMLLSVAAALWQIGNVVLRLIEVVFWPFLLPLRLMRWCVGT